MGRNRIYKSVAQIYSLSISVYYLNISGTCLSFNNRKKKMCVCVAPTVLELFHRCSRKIWTLEAKVCFVFFLIKNKKDKTLLMHLTTPMLLDSK